MIEQKRQCNDEISVLYKVLHKIKPGTIMKITVVPEFVDAILCSEKPYTDINIYNTIKSVYMNMLTNGRGTGMSLRALKCTSRDIFGDDGLWKKDINTSELFFANNLEKIDEVLAIRINSIPDFVYALKNHTSIQYTDYDLYNILKSVCATKVLNGELSFNELTIMNKISRVLTGSPSTWKKERKKNGQN